MDWFCGVPTLPTNANTLVCSAMRRALVTVRGGSLASSMMTSSTWRVLPSPIFTPPAALTASNLSFCPSATMPIIATTPDIGACVPSLMVVSVIPGD